MDKVASKTDRGRESIIELLYLFLKDGRKLLYLLRDGDALSLNRK